MRILIIVRKVSISALIPWWHTDIPAHAKISELKSHGMNGVMICVYACEDTFLWADFTSTHCICCWRLLFMCLGGNVQTLSKCQFPIIEIVSNENGIWHFEPGWIWWLVACECSILDCTRHTMTHTKIRTQWKSDITSAQKVINIANLAINHTYAHIFFVDAPSHDTYTTTFDQSFVFLRSIP